MSTLLVTIALPAEFAKRLDKFIAEEGEGRSHEQTTLEMLKWALLFLKTNSECRMCHESEPESRHMAHDWTYHRIALQMVREFGG